MTLLGLDRLVWICSSILQALRWIQKLLMSIDLELPHCQCLYSYFSGRIHRSDVVSQGTGPHITHLRSFYFTWFVIEDAQAISMNWLSGTKWMCWISTTASLNWSHFQDCVILLSFPTYWKVSFLFVLTESKNFAENVNVTVGKALAMLGVLSGVFRNLYIFKIFYVLCLCARVLSCVWWIFYDVYLDRVYFFRESSLDVRQSSHWDRRTCMIFLRRPTDVLWFI
jgi:hypothetical protein